MSPLLKVRNETSRVERIHVIETSLENAEKLDIKDQPLVAGSFNRRRPLLTLTDHPMNQLGPMVAIACKGRYSITIKRINRVQNF